MLYEGGRLCHWPSMDAACESEGGVVDVSRAVISEVAIEGAAQFLFFEIAVEDESVICKVGRWG